jgi:HAD superfamily hydrolase (TIGR01458 family)
MKFFKPLEKYPKKYVVVGDAQHNFNYENLNKAFRILDEGAQLIAIANNRYFKDNDGALSMDAGCFVSALEYVSGQKAHLIGKPSKEFYHLAAKSLGVLSQECVMIGDDIESDVAGAQQAGLTGVLVKTGKFNSKDLEREFTPDLILDSIAGV